MLRSSGAESLCNGELFGVSPMTNEMWSPAGVQYIEMGSHRLRYRIDGATGPWLLLCNSLGTTLDMWEEQAGVLSRRFRVLRYDARGHGGSSAPPPPYSIADLGRDALALLDGLQIERTHFCGLSIGGLVGQWLGINASARLEKLILCATAAKIGTKESWEARIATVRANGMGTLVQATAERWFTPACHAARPESVQAILDRFVETSDDGYCGCCSALADVDFRNQLGQIDVRVLAISGDDDPVCPPADSQFLADAVTDGRHLSVPGRHLCNLESPAAFTAVVAEFLQTH